MGKSGEPIAGGRDLVFYLSFKKGLNKDHSNRCRVALNLFGPRPKGRKLRPEEKNAAIVINTFIEKEAPVAAIVLICACGLKAIAKLLGRADEFIKFWNDALKRKPKLFKMLFLALNDRLDSDLKRRIKEVFSISISSIAEKFIQQDQAKDDNGNADGYGEDPIGQNEEIHQARSTATSVNPPDTVSEDRYDQRPHESSPVPNHVSIRHDGELPMHSTNRPEPCQPYQPSHSSGFQAPSAYHQQNASHENNYIHPHPQYSSSHHQSSSSPDQPHLPSQDYDKQQPKQGPSRSQVTPLLSHAPSYGTVHDQRPLEHGRTHQSPRETGASNCAPNECMQLPINPPSRQQPGTEEPTQLRSQPQATIASSLPSSESNLLSQTPSSRPFPNFPSTRAAISPLQTSKAHQTRHHGSLSPNMDDAENMSRESTRVTASSSANAESQSAQLGNSSSKSAHANPASMSADTIALMYSTKELEGGYYTGLTKLGCLRLGDYLLGGKLKSANFTLSGDKNIAFINIPVEEMYVRDAVLWTDEKKWEKL